MKDAFKRKSTLLVFIGFILYAISTCIPSVTIDTRAYAEANGIEGIFNGINTVPLILFGFFYVVPVLIGLVEFICAITIKKAVFALSVIQTVVTIPVFVIMQLLLSGIKADGDLVSKSILVYFPIVACVLLLVGGIMFKKEKAMNKLSGGVQSIVFCQKCGSQLNEGAAFCPKCGAKNDTATGIRGQE